jgi:Xaa-Pro aminopeptidase
MNERIERAVAALRARGLEAALLSSPHNVCYVGGYEVPIEAGPSAFAGGPDLALLDADGAVTLIVPDLEESAAHAGGQADAVVAYPAFSHLERHDQPANEWAALRGVLRASGVLGIEPATLPAYLERAMRADLPDLRLGDATPAQAAARLVKTEDEITRLRRAVDLTAVGQQAARRLLRPGMTEIELFAGLRGAMERAAGRRLPLAGDLVAGAARTANVGGWPLGGIIGPDDLVLVDLAPRLDGYWGDSCNTLLAGEPSAEQRRMLEATTGALAAGIAAARPGLPARDLDAVCRRHVESYGYTYPHHSGHALGTTVHEDPRLVPYETTPLQAGMVLALEPAAYVPGVGGVRTEHVILITSSGAELLSSFPHGF